MAATLLTLIRDLSLRRGRERRGLALAEGVRLLEEALAAGVSIKGVAISPALEATARGASLKAALERRGVPCDLVSERTLDGLADTEHPQGVMAVIEPPRWSLDNIPAGAATVVLVLDGVQDPGNVGTIARTGLALGADGLIALKGTAELANPKVLRSSMGALFRLPSVAASREEFLGWARHSGVAIWIAAADGEPVTGRTPMPPARGTALVLGNEGAGISDELTAATSARVGILLRPGAESLNVAVAAGILLYEVRRER